MGINTFSHKKILNSLKCLCKSVSIGKYIYIFIYIRVCVCVCALTRYKSTHKYKWYTHPLNRIYIYLYTHPQTLCFVVSQLFNVARQVWRLKLASKPAQLYYLTAQPPGDLRQLGNNKALCSNFRLFTFCHTEYQSAQFIRRVFQNACGSR